MSMKWGSGSRPTFKKDFLRFIAERVAVAGRVMPGCDRREYEAICARYCRLYGELCGRVREGDRGLLAELDFTGASLADFDADNAYIQGFADGMVFMGLFKKV
jgi:hypothetical protein